MPISQQLLDDIKNNVYCKRFLDLSGDDLDDDDFLELSEYLKENIYIKSIDLTETRIGDESAKIIANMVFLENVNVSSTLIEKAGIQALLKSSLKVLSICSLAIEDDWLEAIEENKSLEELRIISSGITCEGARLISKNKHLKHLNIMNNFVKDDGIKCLSKMKSLYSLTDAFNPITISGKEAVLNSKIKEYNKKIINEDQNPEPEPPSSTLTILFDEKRARESSEEKEVGSPKKRKLGINGGH